MNRDQKSAVVDDVAAQIREAEAVIAVDYRGLSVTQAVELRRRLGEADATFRVVKNRLTTRAADKAGADSLKAVLEGPTAFAFVRGDAALAAKALATFRREHGIPEFKGGTLEGEPLSREQVESIARLPGRDALQGQFVGVLAAPITGLVRGLGGLLGGLALQLGQIQERELVGSGGDAPPGPAGEPSTEATDQGADGQPEPSEAPGDPAAEGEAAERDDEGADADAAEETSTAQDDQDASGEADAKEG